MEKIKTVIIGLGRIASLLDEDSLREKPCTHSGAVAADSDCILAAGCDINEERRLLFAEKWNVPVFGDASQMLHEIKPQLLVIATPPDSHYKFCRLAFDMKVPAVICEKPLADNIAGARKIADLAAKNHPVIIVNHERRYSKDYILAKEILDGKKLGNILRVSAYLYMGKTRKLLDQFWHDGTHLADAVMFLTGMRLKHRRCWGARLDSRSGTAWLEGALEGKSEKRKKKKAESIPVILEIGAGRDHLVFEIEFSCESGRLRIGNGVFEVWESAESPYAEDFRSLKKTGEVFSGPTGYFANMLKDAAACVRDPSRTPRSGAADGLRVIEYLNSVRKWQ